MKLYTEENKVQFEIINDTSLNIIINDDDYHALSRKYTLLANEDLYYSPFTSDNLLEGVYTSEGSKKIFLIKKN